MTKKKQRRRASRQERELAEATGGKQQRGSGALPWAKGDVRARGRYRAECKFTKARSYVVKRSILDKISSECSFGEVPVLDIAFVDSSGMTADRWVAVPYSCWEKLCESL